LAFGSAALLVVAGTVCAVALSDGTGQILAHVFIAVGLVWGTSLVFLEVGLSEDRERARERAARARAARARERALERAAMTSRPAAKRRRLERPNLGRSRGHQRRLR
jgi:hypothetical protein